MTIDEAIIKTVPCVKCGEKPTIRIFTGEPIKIYCDCNKKYALSGDLKLAVYAWNDMNRVRS